ncbi:MAG TPA: magnesium transporter [Longimicrobiales bacterium]
MSTVEASGLPEERGVRADHVHDLLLAGETERLAGLLSELHPSDLADLVEELDEDDRVILLELLPAELASETLAEMESEEHPEELLASLEPERIGELIAELSDDDAVDLIGELPPEEQARILASLPRLEAGELRRLLQYDEESAGGIMTTELVAVSVHLSAGEAIEEVRRQARELGGEFYSIFVVDLLRRLLGTVTIQELVLADPKSPLRELVEPPVTTVPVDMDQEEVGRIIARYNIPSVPVVGPDNVLLGRVTWDDVIDVLEAEQTEDILRLGGVVSEEEVRGGWAEAVRSRLPWLFINLLTAAVAASVVGIFIDTIESVAVLAVIMPVIAGMGGNSGTQTLAVTVRRLALTQESEARRWGVVAKELLVGLVNGAALGGCVAAVSYLLGLVAPGYWPATPMLGVVVLLAMWGNLVVASLAGAFVPILLERMGVDPAIASSIFVTTFTDLAGFFLLLGLASALLL